MLAILRDIFKKRTLIWQLVQKDLKIRYSRPIFGFFWAFLSPFLMVVIFYIIFFLVLKIKIEETPFILYLMTAVFPWRFFQDSLNSATTSLIDNKHLIKEANFPHYLISISIVLANMINFLPSLVLMIIASLFILKGLPLLIIFLPAILIIHFAIATGFSIMLSVIYVKWRDIKYILEAALLLTLYSTPVFYSIYSLKPSLSQFLFNAYIFNPFVALLHLYRFALLKGFYNNLYRDVGSFFILFVICIYFAATVLFLGFYCYQKNKSWINDNLSY